MEIKHLNTESDILLGYPVMKHLRTHLDEKSYLSLVKEAQQQESYQLVGVFDNSRLVAVTGFMPMVTLYNGKFIWVCDLVTDPDVRSKGYGEALLTYVHDWAQEQGYNKVSLSSGLQRTDAHRFYEEKMKYDRVSYVFLKKLGS
ncbi:GNAT family N-acetyltransferase [Bacillus sp. HMF5848]|uniref:GNAT family N-acetyltransferase n=1 Tax=Bacillus sp. HMF5848 TaxID=2495421 RepID=UPI000F786F49|nr:GNAT family N-acetyltransferase [Bacillus sp. HMF5848]RSK25607.1 GNAT family N-acetyltransferase [Bacillus sp. HMF5848]